jgi:AcrR family transcriptional regulator
VGGTVVVMPPATDDVRERLLRAAHDLLAAEGPGALTVRRIAAEAGMSTMNLYSRFGGKDGVVEQLFVDGFTRLGEAMDAATATDDPMADLDACGTAYRRFALDNPTYYAVMFEGVVPDFEPSPEAMAAAEATLRTLADRLARAMDAGALAPADPLQTAAVVWATCHGVVSLELREMGPPGIDWPAAYERALHALMAGLAVPADARTGRRRQR